MIEKYFRRLTFCVYRKKYHTQLLLFYIATWCTTLIFFPLMHLSNIFLGNSDSGPDMKNWFLVIIVAPIIETFINQFGVFRIFNSIKITRGKQGWIILLSAFIFGLTHTYSLSYMVFGFSMGIVLAYIYYLFHHTPQKAFWTTALIHSFRNLTAIVLLAFV